MRTNLKTAAVALTLSAMVTTGCGAGKAAVNGSDDPTVETTRVSAPTSSEPLFSIAPGVTVPANQPSALPEANQPAPAPTTTVPVGPQDGDNTPVAPVAPGLPAANLVPAPAGSEKTVPTVATDGKMRQWSYYYPGGDIAALVAQATANAQAAGWAMSEPVNAPGVMSSSASAPRDGVKLIISGASFGGTTAIIDYAYYRI